jgi:transcriptional regulator with XRE-family HTH domain
MTLQVKLERIARNLRSYEFAQMLGLDPQRYYKFESGAKQPPPEVAEKTSELLGLPASELFSPVNMEPIGVGN